MSPPHHPDRFEPGRAAPDSAQPSGPLKGDGPPGPIGREGAEMKKLYKYDKLNSIQGPPPSNLLARMPLQNCEDPFTPPCSSLTPSAFHASTSSLRHEVEARAWPRAWAERSPRLHLGLSAKTDHNHTYSRVCDLASTLPAQV